MFELFLNPWSMAAGAGLVGLGLARAPRGDAQAVARGARIYAAECAACHGARLEGGAAALVFASGMAAATAVFRALPPGSHVVAPRVVYWGLRKWLAAQAAAGRLRVEFVPLDDLDAVRRAVRPGETRLLWAETPANPLWVVADLAALAEIAHTAGARLVVDNTVATPLLTRPLALGADLVVHSATKYLNGHSDLFFFFKQKTAYEI